MLLHSGLNGFIQKIEEETKLSTTPNGLVVKPTKRDVLMKGTVGGDKDAPRQRHFDPILSSLLEKLDRCRLLAAEYENPKISSAESTAPVENISVVESTVTTEVEIHNCRPIGSVQTADPTAPKLTAALNISSKPFATPPTHSHQSHCCSDVSCSAGRNISTWAECTPNETSAGGFSTLNSFGLPSMPPGDAIGRFASLIEPLNDGIVISQYQNERQMPAIMKLITKDLSEPYSIYTYRYFIHNWPHLCFLANDGDESIGAIVCKLDYHKTGVRRGYIAMLAVDENYRRHKIGSRLVKKAIYSMIEKECDEVVLETEVTNKSALGLYERLGFVRDKRLFRYYLNGVDAFRLKLWLRNPYANFVNMYE